METFEEHYDSMCAAIARRMPTADMELIDKAVRYADEKHKSQKRKDGSPYIIHPLAVAEIVVEMGLDMDAILGALLHDCIEDTDASHEEIEKLFGSTVAELVEGVTKLTRANFSSTEEAQMENLRKMFMAMSKDIRVVLIKIADRLHNMRTMQYQSPEKQIIKCRETMDVYAPLAHRLGMQKIKWELEDTSLRYLAPKEYTEITNYLQKHHEKDEAFMQSIQFKITDRLNAMGIQNTTYGRIKHVYSIYRKMLAQDKTIDQLYDIYAFRVIVDTIPDCYNVLGVIHDMFKPVPGRFKDYISTPKPNMYQSVHTTVIGSEGIPFEVQIRTWDMHHTAEYGIAAHWKYKMGDSSTAVRAGDEDKFAWVRRLLESQQESDAQDFFHNLKIDMFADEVFVFSPKGDVISLPVGSTVIDFAYAIHSAVGNRMIGAKVDGRIVPIDYKVKNGEIIDIITTNQQDHGPARDWLNIVKTSEARSKIRSWFKKERRPENIAEGKAILEREFRRDFVFTEEKKEQFIQHFSEVYHCNSVDDFYAAIGYGGILISRLIPRMKDEYNRNYKPTPETQKPVLSTVSPKLVKSTEGVVVEGVDNCLIKLARCCEPLPGDSIIGFITRGHGVSIHKRDCPNVPKDISSCEQPDRWIKARWANRQGDGFKATVVILAVDRQSLLADVTNTLVNMRAPLHNVNARELKDGNCEILITISTEGTEHLKNIIAKLGKISNVFSVERTGN